MKTKMRLLVPLACAAIPSAPALAQLEEIVVTATRRVESLQDVPISVTAVTGEAIAQGGFSDLEEISQFIPNLYMRDTFVGQRLSIRGIGTSPSNEAFEQAVAQFHDGVYYGRDNLGQNGFFDLERVEVVRGPQPVFAGMSATAGALNVISRRPGDSLDGSVQVSYGSDEETSIEFGVGGPISDTFGLRVAGRYYDLADTGYYQITSGENLGTRENTSARVTGVWDPTDRFSLTFKYEYQDIWQIGTPGKFNNRCELRPQFSTSNTGLSPNMPALCAVDALFSGTRADLNSRFGGVGSGGAIDIWDAVESIDAEQGLTPGDRTNNAVYGGGLGPGGLVQYGNSYTPRPCAPGEGATGTGCSPVLRGMNQIREFGERETRQFQADIFFVNFDWDITDNITLSAITSLVEYDKEDWLDPDASSFAIFSDLREEFFEQTAQEIRLTSTGDQAFEWMAGVYWQDHELDTLIDIYIPWHLGPPPGVWTDPNAIAIGYGSRLVEDSTWNAYFFTGTYNFTETFRLNFGGRYQDVSKGGVLTPTVGSLLPGATQYEPFTAFPAGGPQPITGLNADGDDFLPEVGIQYDFGDDSMFYAKYSEAFKAGGFIMAPAPAGMFPNPPDYRAEFAEGIELGIKTRIGDTVELNLSLYDTDYTDLQVTIFDPQTSSFYTSNAAEANTKGIEIDGRWAPSDAFSLGFSGALGDAKYVSRPGAQECNSLVTKQWVVDGNGPASTCSVDLSGVAMPYQPDWSLGLAPRYDFMLGNLGASFSANVFFSDGYTIGDDMHPNTFVDDVTRIDLRLAFMPADGAWEIAIYGRDVTDEQLQVGGGERNFQSRSLDLVYDTGGADFERGSRYGIQAAYFFGR